MYPDDFNDEFLKEFETEIIELMGFKSCKEFSSMIASIDLSNIRQKRAFELWRDCDGTKEGFISLMKKYWVNLDTTNPYKYNRPIMNVWEEEGITEESSSVIFSEYSAFLN